MLTWEKLNWNFQFISHINLSIKSQSKSNTVSKLSLVLCFMIAGSIPTFQGNIIKNYPNSFIISLFYWLHCTTMIPLQQIFCGNVLSLHDPRSQKWSSSYWKLVFVTCKVEFGVGKWNVGRYLKGVRRVLSHSTALHFINLSKTLFLKVPSHGSVSSGMCFHNFVLSKSELQTGHFTNCRVTRSG